ncbi:hypothetical protein [Nocardioides sp. Soil796]|uniref:hypothetical protein n=1 Tax=Nocardioides sp. Soil796 TaxID=1736412 RepID=UPI00070D084D|nr:hypothetical protein [Nocardioides sp. Soil796]KRF14670.1 hypothetical protein ASH02_10210 [Nocardioides sp. Soil796]
MDLRIVAVCALLALVLLGAAPAGTAVPVASGHSRAAFPGPERVLAPEAQLDLGDPQACVIPAGSAGSGHAIGRVADGCGAILTPGRGDASAPGFCVQQIVHHGDRVSRPCRAVRPGQRGEIVPLETAR